MLFEISLNHLSELKHHALHIRLCHHRAPALNCRNRLCGGKTGSLISTGSLGADTGGSGSLGAGTESRALKRTMSGILGFSLWTMSGVIDSLDTGAGPGAGGSGSPGAGAGPGAGSWGLAARGPGTSTGTAGGVSCRAWSLAAEAMRFWKASIPTSVSCVTLVVGPAYIPLQAGISDTRFVSSQGQYHYMHTRNNQSYAHAHEHNTLDVCLLGTDIGP